MRVALNRQEQVVGLLRCADEGGRGCRASGDEDRGDGWLVARLVEVLEVKRVVPHLVDGVGGELLLADLELQDEDHRPNQEDDIDPPAKSRDGILEIQFAAIAVWTENVLEDVDLFEPRIALWRLDGELAVLHQDAQDIGGCPVEERRDGVGIISTSHSVHPQDPAADACFSTRPGTRCSLCKPSYCQRTWVQSSARRHPWGQRASCIAQRALATLPPCHPPLPLHIVTVSQCHIVSRMPAAGKVTRGL